MSKPTNRALRKSHASGESPSQTAGVFAGTGSRYLRPPCGAAQVVLVSCGARLARIVPPLSRTALRSIYEIDSTSSCWAGIKLADGASTSSMPIGPLFRRHSEGLAEQKTFGEQGLELTRRVFAA